MPEIRASPLYREAGGANSLRYDCLFRGVYPRTLRAVNDGSVFWAGLLTPAETLGDADHRFANHGVLRHRYVWSVLPLTLDT